MGTDGGTNRKVLKEWVYSQGRVEREMSINIHIDADY